MCDDPEETCPFDEAHRVATSRMPYHVMRCIVNHPNSKKKQCPYVAHHYVDPQDYDRHCNECKGKETYGIQYCTLKDNSVGGSLEEPVEQASSCDTHDRGWGIGTEQVQSPLQVIQYRTDTQPLIGASKAKRKAHRMEQRLMHHMEDHPKKAESTGQANNPTRPANNTSNINVKPKEKTVKVPSDEPKDLPVEKESESMPPTNSAELQPENLDMSKLSISNDTKVVKSTNANPTNTPVLTGWVSLFSTSTTAAAAAAAAAATTTTTTNFPQLKYENSGACELSANDKASITDENKDCNIQDIVETKTNENKKQYNFETSNDNHQAVQTTATQNRVPFSYAAALRASNNHI